MAIEEFIIEPKKYLDFDGNLAIDVKKLYDKRIKQLDERKKMGVHNIENITDEDLV